MSACQHCGSELIEGNRFCVACGTPISESPLEPDALDPTMEAAPTPALEPASDPTHTSQRAPAPPSATTDEADLFVDETSATEVSLLANAGAAKRRRMPLIIGGVLILAVAAGVMVFLALRDGGDSVATTGGYSGPNDDVVFLLGRDGGGGVDEVSFVKFGSDDRPTEIADWAFTPAEVLGRGSNVAESGGPIIATVLDDDEVQVVSVDRDSGEITTLLDGGDQYLVVYDPGRDHVSAKETRQSGERCYVGRVDEQLQRIGRGDRCTISRDGAHVMSTEVDGDETTYEIVDVDGTRLLVGDSVLAPQFADFGGALIAFEGSSDRYSVALVDIESGEIVAESERGVDARVLGESSGGQLLVATRGSEGEATLERLGTDGTVVELLVNEGPIGADFLTEASDDIVVVTVTEDGSELSIVTVEGDGTVEVQSVANGDYVDLHTPGFGDHDGTFLAVVGEFDDADAVMYVPTGVGVIEIDLNDFDSVSSTHVAANARRLMVEVGSAADGEFTSGLLTVDLGSGESDWLLEEWSSMSVEAVMPDGTGVLVTGREDAGDRDEVAAHVDLAGTVELVDEGPDVSDVRYTADRGSVIFTVSDGDVDTYLYEIGSRTQPTLLYRDASIGWAGWDADGAPRQISRVDAIEVAIPSAACRSLFPDLTVLTVNGTAAGSIESFESQTFCMTVPVGGPVQILVDGAFDSRLDVEGPYTVDGETEYPIESYSNDDYDGVNAGLDVNLDPGAYRVTVSGYDDLAGSFTIRAG